MAAWFVEAEIDGRPSENAPRGADRQAGEVSRNSNYETRQDFRDELKIAKRSQSAKLRNEAKLRKRANLP